MSCLSIHYLLKIRESGSLSLTTKKVIDIILAAINDWPTELSNLEEFDKEVHQAVNKKINQQTLEQYLSSIDYSKDAWIAESLYQLLEIFNYYENGKFLTQILNEIKEQILDKDDIPY